MSELNFDYIKDLTGNSEEIIPMDEFMERTWVNPELESKWYDNYSKNKSSIQPAKQRNDGRVAILVGASPGINKNYEVLKNIDDNFVIISSLPAAKFLVDNDIIPDFVFAVDAAYHNLDDLDFDHSGTTLVTSPFVMPEILNAWTGKAETYLLGGGKGFNETIIEDWGKHDIGGGNVISAAYLWAYKYLQCRHFIVMGVSLCFYKDYYFDGRKKPNETPDEYNGWYNAVDIYGEVVSTTPTLTMYKTWFETYVKHINEHGGGSFINSTEDGILGAYPELVASDKEESTFRLKFIPWISIVPLSVAIEGHKLRLRENNNGSRN